MIGQCGFRPAELFKFERLDTFHKTMGPLHLSDPDYDDLHYVTLVSEEGMKYRYLY